MRVRFLQNRIAESALLLPVAAAASLLLQLASGLPTTMEWASLACYAITCYLMIELSNSNALLRVRSRMVTSTFIVLSAATGCLSGTLSAAIAQLFMVITLLILFTTYQDQASTGRTFYAFAALGVSTLFFSPALFYVPVLWVMMATQLQSLSWRTWAASLIGLLTPYWLWTAWLLFQQDLSPLASHFSLFTFHFSPLASHFSLPTFHFPLNTFHFSLFITLALAATGAVHFWTYSYEDKIRIRLLYGFFTTMTVCSTLLLVLMPHHYEPLVRLLLITASPLIAHFFTHTASRLTNIVFIATIIVAFALTIATLFL